MQLLARGPQNVYLDVQPQWNPFLACYKRHTRFATEHIEREFLTGFAWGKTNTLEIPRSGDVLGNMVLEVRLPVLAGATGTWADGIGYVLLRRVRLIIDDLVLQDQERLWYDLSDRLFIPEGKLRGLGAMTGRAAGSPRGQPLSLTQAHVLHVPLKLLCCKAHFPRQNFMPLLAAPGSTIRLEIQAEELAKCVAPTATLPAELPDALDARMILEYGFLDVAERDALLTEELTLMFESQQDMEAQAFKEVNSSDGLHRVPLDVVKVDMSEVNAPVKMLVWVVYDQTYASTNQ